MPTNKYKMECEMLQEKDKIAKSDMKKQMKPVAKQLQPFLLKFRTDGPMAPFLGQSLKDLLLTLMGRFIKKDVLEQADSYPKLAAIDPCEEKTGAL